jgi:hypothetical protein
MKYFIMASFIFLLFVICGILIFLFVFNGFQYFQSNSSSPNVHPSSLLPPSSTDTPSPSSTDCYLCNKFINEQIKACDKNISCLLGIQKLIEQYTPCQNCNSELQCYLEKIKSCQDLSTPAKRAKCISRFLTPC